MAESHTFAVQRNPVSRLSNKPKHKLRKHAATTTTTKSIFSGNSSHTRDTITTSRFDKTRRSNSKSEVKVQKQKEEVLLLAEPVKKVSFSIPLDVKIQIEKIARQLQRQQLLTLKDQQKPMSVKTKETKGKTPKLFF